MYKIKIKYLSWNEELKKVEDTYDHYWCRDKATTELFASAMKRKGEVADVTVEEVE